MSIHAQISDEARAALAAQKRTSTISSIVIAILACFLLGLILFVIAMTVEVKRPPEIISYNAAVADTENVEKPEITNEVVKPPSAPAMSMTRVIASSASANLSVPNPTEDVTELSLEFSSSEDFSDEFSDASWGESGAAAASFFGQKVEAERIAYVIDYSMSMGGKRDKLMRKELAQAIGALPSSMDYQMIYFAGPAWVAGDKVEMAKDRKTCLITDQDGKEYRWASNKGAHGWTTRSQRQKAKWIKATPENIERSLSHVKKTPLVWGTDWDAPLRMALDMRPAPDVIYFMTDGASGGESEKLAKTIGSLAKNRGIKINTIAMMVPSAKEAMGEMAKRSGGQFSVVNENGTTEVVIKGE
jgi:hypothetical protein